MAQGSQWWSEAVAWTRSNRTMTTWNAERILRVFGTRDAFEAWMRLTGSHWGDAWAEVVRRESALEGVYT